MKRIDTFGNWEKLVLPKIAQSFALGISIVCVNEIGFIFNKPCSIFSKRIVIVVNRFIQYLFLVDTN